MKLSCLGLLLALAAGCAPTPPVPPAPAAVKRVRIVQTSDFHGRMLPQTPDWANGRAVGGSAVLAAHFDSAAARFDGPTFVLSGGDDMQGTTISNLTWGRSTIAAHNASGYDAAALGNHEFDWGQDTLRARIRESRFPWLGANVYRAGTRAHPEWLRPWAMLEDRGVRVAVIGVALPETPSMVLANRTSGLEFGPGAPAIDQAAREARAAGADFVVVTMHIGATCEYTGNAPGEESGDCRGAMLELARAITQRVDLILGGHTHRRVLTSVGNTPTLEAGWSGTAYSLADLERRGDSTVVLRREVRNSWADEVTPDSAVARVVAEWDRSVRPISERPVVTLASPLPRADNNRGEYALGNLVADAYRMQTGARVGLTNNGGIRRGLPAGVVSYGVLYELHPFQNELVVVDLTGAQLRAALEAGFDEEGRVDTQISGMTVRYDPAAPRGSRIREIRLGDGRVVGGSDRVSVATSEFVALGGEAYAPFLQGTLRRTGLIDLEGVSRYLRSLPQPVRAPQTGRWIPVQ